MSTSNSNETEHDPYNRGGLIAFVFTMVFSLLFFVWISFFHPGVNLHEVKEKAPAPTSAEAPVAAAASTFDASKVEKPWEDSKELIAHGEKVYHSNCAVCHGDKGMGDGPAGTTLVPRPRNFVEGKWKIGGDSASLFKTITSGIEGSSMASFKHLSVVDRWSVIHFIRSITKNKVKDNMGELEKFAATAK